MMNEAERGGERAATEGRRAPQEGLGPAPAHRVELSRLREWAAELGFSSLGVASLALDDAEPGLRAWLEAGWHGEMDYMARHADLRVRPRRLVPGAITAVMVTLDYTPARVDDWRAAAWRTLEDPSRAYVARYALGRDYHKVVRSRLARLADRLAERIGPYGHRVFCDSAPVLEVELARRAGLGWRGKHTLLLNRDRGSMGFIGTLYTDLPLPSDSPVSAHCGRCERCIEVCPTRAIVAPERLDARRCIAYLTIELSGSIPETMRPLIGNRIFGCDDCQLVCPWNRYAQAATLADFAPRHGLDAAQLAELFSWTREGFERRTAGSAIRRIGHERWLRNIAVALGNGARQARCDPSASERARAVLLTRIDDPSPLVREHVRWALEQCGPAS